MPIFAFAIGYTYSKHFILKDFLFSTLFILLLQAAATIQNDIADIHLDNINTPQKKILGTIISIKEAQTISIYLFIIALLLAGSVSILSIITVLIVLLLSWAYNNKPLQFSHSGYFAIPLLAILYTGIPMAYGLLLGPTPLTLLIIVLLIIWTVQRASIVMLKDFADQEGDKMLGKRTFLILFGHSRTSLISIIFSTICGVGTLIYAVLFFHIPLLFIFFLILITVYGIELRIKILREKDPHLQWKLFAQTFQNENRFELLYAFLIATRYFLIR